MRIDATELLPAIAADRVRKHLEAALRIANRSPGNADTWQQWDITANAIYRAQGAAKQLPR
jgi:hypothetical protein